MAKSNKSKPVKSSGWLMNLCAFIAVILIGVSLIFTKIGAFSSVAMAFQIIANVIAYIVVGTVSFFYVRNRKNIWLWVVWGISIALIVVSYII